MGVIKWFIDGSHNTHWDCKGHSGAMMVMGCGAIYSFSRRIKVNTRMSTETELVSVDAYMPEVLRSLYFIQAQGYGFKYAEIHQDNVRAQMMDTNGKISSSRKTRHIKAKFSFIKDKVNNKEVEMWTDQQE